jgi:hypothetical protein
MTKLTRLAAIAGPLALALVIRIGPAAALGQGADALLKASAATSSVELTHGCHRACVVGRVPRWAAIRFHRHAGPRCLPLRC